MKTIAFILWIIFGLLAFATFGAFWLAFTNHDYFDIRYVIVIPIFIIASIIFRRLSK